MHIEELRDYCLNKKGATESFPFDETTLVFKVAGKMFLLTDLEGNFSINIKNTPEKVIALREMYPCIHPGYHMNKKYWITVNIEGSINDTLLYRWIDESYGIIVDSLPKKQKEALCL